jgi:hypothetical protein
LLQANNKDKSHPSEKYFENALKLKSSPQNNGISSAFLKQKQYRSDL